MITTTLIILVLLGGCIALGIVVLPAFRRAESPAIPSMVIPLEDIASIWTRHNQEMAPLSAEELSADDLGIPLHFDSPAEAQPSPAAVTGPVEEAPLEEAPPTVVHYKLDSSAKFEGNIPAKATPKPTVVIPLPKAAPDPQPVSPATAKPTAVLNLSTLAQTLKSLLDDCITPNSQVIRSQGAEEAIRSLLTLIESHGHHPSVVIDSKDEESLDMITVRENLAKITLRDHTYAVCRYMMGNLKTTYKDYEQQVPTVLIAALAHDIGKIPEFRLSGLYNSKDHAKVSAGKLAEMIGDNNPLWGKRAIRAVTNHHLFTNDDMTVMLKQADRQARQAELAICTRAFTVKPFSEWFRLEKYLKEYIAPGVNVQQTSKWNAFSFKGVIFARPDWLWEQAKKMCQDEKVMDLTFIYISEKDSATRMIVSELRKANLTPLLGDGYLARKFDIRTTTSIRKGPAHYLTAFTIPDYIDAASIESHKFGYTEIISEVLPI